MRRTISLLLVLAVCLTALTGITPLRLGLRFGSQGGSPLSLPQLTATQAAGMFSFLGSFSISAPGPYYPGNYAGGSLFIDGSTLYTRSFACDPAIQYCGTGYTEGISTLTLPTLSGTPDYTGGNASPVAAASAVAPGVTPIANYSFTVAPVTGATSATFVSLPPNIAANAGWYLDFNGFTTIDEVTAISGNTVSWATALPSGTYTTTIPVYQWAPVLPWGSDASYPTVLTGAAVFNGHLYVTGAVSYDTGGETLGWVAESTLPMSGSSWGAINVPATPTNSRSLAGPLYPTPTAWQSLFGPDYSTSGPGLSIASNGVPQGPSFQEFNYTDITMAGATTPITPALLYTTTQSLEGRTPDGPFPLTTTTGYYPATLTMAPAMGDTSVAVSLPSTNVVLTANVSTNDAVAITAITSGTISNSGIGYTATDSAGVFAGGSSFQPSFDYAPGTAIGVGDTILVGPDPSAAASADTVTMTPDGYNSLGYTFPWTMFFSDGESRVGTFSGSTGTFTFSPALTGCASGCTTSVTLGPMGDKWVTDYDGPYGTGFFVPGFSTFMSMGYHEYGPPRLRNSRNCGGNAPSGSFDTPMAPDTVAYNQVLLYLYSAQQILNGAQGTQPVYQANPYATLPFPDQSNVLSSTGCPQTINGSEHGWAYLGPSNILYLSVGSGGGLVYEYQVTPP